MPVIFQKGHIKFCIHPNDHNPPHVQIYAAGSELVVDLRSLVVEVAIGFTLRQIRELLNAVEKHQEMLIDEWENYHG